QSVEYQYFLPDENGELDEWGVVYFKECSARITTTPVMSCSFDEDGNIVESQVFDEENEIMLYLQHLYDENNRVKEIIYSDKSFPPHPIIETFAYDKKGNTINQHRELENKEISRDVTKKYDKNNNIIKEIILDVNKNRNIKEKKEIIYAYNSNNLCIKKDILINGKKLSYTIYKYDDSKNLILQQFFYKDKLKNEYSFAYYSNEEIKSSKFDEIYNYSTEYLKGALKGVKQEVQKTYNSDGELEEYYIKKIDINGYWLEKANIDENNNEKEKYVYTYDKKYNLIKKEYYKNNILTHWETYSYNEKGLKTQEISYLKDGKIDFYEDKTYKYDKKGNPIEEKSTNKEGNILYLYKINYTYYE
ncbi:MAG: hypothetical protein Q3983_08000, partial [Capnocytophaga sp.]|nr:hypothetical protein [Capnocytophaga sp.]